MNHRLFIYVSLFTLLVCCLFVNYNPNIAEDLTGNYSDGDVFMPNDNHFDFKAFSLNDTVSHNYTVKTISHGHVQFIDDTGNITINLIQFDNMIRSSRDWHNSLLENELENPSWTVDGVCIHEIDFIFYDPLYSAYQKNSSSNTAIYLSTPSEKQTAEMMNSLRFN